MKSDCQAIYFGDIGIARVENRNRRRGKSIDIILFIIHPLKIPQQRISEWSALLDDALARNACTYGSILHLFTLRRLLGIGIKILGWGHTATPQSSILPIGSAFYE